MPRPMEEQVAPAITRVSGRRRAARGQKQSAESTAMERNQLSMELELHTTDEMSESVPTVDQRHAWVA